MPDRSAPSLRIIESTSLCANPRAIAIDGQPLVSIEYLVLAVRNDYRGNDDFQKVYSFLETLSISSRIQLPLRGVVVIGY